MNILILEDDLSQLNSLKKILCNHFPDYTVFCASKYKDGISILNNNTIDIFLLDIQLNETNLSYNGKAFANYIRTFEQYLTTPIIFITSLHNEVLDCINIIHCYSYITKPIVINELIDAINSSSFITPSYSLHPNNPQIKLRLNNNIVTSIKYTNLMYIESQNHTISLKCINDCYTTNHYKLSELETMLPAHFIRCHRSYIINQTYVNAYDKGKSEVHINNTIIPIGRLYKSTFEAQYFHKYSQEN